MGKRKKGNKKHNQAKKTLELIVLAGTAVTLIIEIIVKIISWLR